MSALRIRDAVAADAEAACDVMRRSIAELCTADHRDDPEILAQWLANKHPDIFRGWMAQSRNSFLVAGAPRGNFGSQSGFPMRKALK
jgi:hypothetical protein